MTSSRILASTAASVAALVLLVGCSGGSSDEPQADSSSSPSSSASGGTGSDEPSVTPPPVKELTAVTCAAKPDVVVQTASQLEDALEDAEPGTSIRLKAGTYEGEFQTQQSGTKRAPIELCGSKSAVLSGGPTDGGYTLHLDGADYWRVIGFTLRGGQKGLMADGAVGNLIDGITVTGTGDEAIHLRANSTDNVVQRATVRDTGLRKEKYGEGIYIGTAESNWCDISDCEPDRSDRNLIRNNDIAETTAESVDIKEGTTAGILRDNTFSGVGMTEGDSWVDVKGNSWTIEGNRGDQTPEDGFQVHQILDGWGQKNVFKGNVAVVDGDGYGINVTKRHDDNVVDCSNVARSAGSGLTTIDCT